MEYIPKLNNCLQELVCSSVTDSFILLRIKARTSTQNLQNFNFVVLTSYWMALVEVILCSSSKFFFPQAPPNV